MNHALRSWGPAAAWAAVLFLLGSIPGSALDWTADLDDLALHFAFYTVLGVALAYGRTRAGHHVPHWALLMLGALYGAGDEWHQSLVPGRFPAVADWVADTLGVVVGYGVALRARGSVAVAEDEGEHP